MSQLSKPGTRMGERCADFVTQRCFYV